MRNRRVWNYTRPIVMALLITIGGASAAFAETSSSANYQLSESGFNAGSLDETCSGQYCARTSIGDLAVGNSLGATSTANFGPITPNEPSLEVIVEPGASDVGVLTTERTATKTMVVRVRNYLSGGYILQITGNPPRYGNHTLATPSTPTPSQQGTEQFAINAAVNTSPAVGAAPVQVPSGQFSFGVVNADYAIANQFKYTSGDDIAYSLTESGRTDYTISMIINIAQNTPAGRYSGDFSVVVIPVY